MRKCNVTRIHAVLVVVLLGFGLERAAAVTYTQIRVPGSVSTQARVINNTGQVVGSYITASQTHGYLLSGSQYTTIDFPGATSTTISNPEVISSPVGLVPTNALVAINSRIVGKQEAIRAAPG